MSGFLTPLRVQLINERGEGGRSVWRLLTPLRFYSDVLNRVYEVPHGFDTDFASVPRMPISSMYLGVANKAATLHDHAYRAKDLTKDEADNLFLEAMESEGIPERHILYAAVRAFGQSSYDPNAPSMWPDPV